MSLTVIWTAARRVSAFANSVIEAHSLGIIPGSCREPWTAAFQQEVFPKFREVLPDEYLAGLGARFREAAQAMAVQGCEPDTAADWLIVSTYLNSAGAVLERELQGVVTDVVVPFEDHPPSITPYSRVAEHVSREGALRLAAAGQAVASFARPATACPLDPDQLELLQQIAVGRRVSDVARATGYSERSVYRRLQDAWRKIGVEGRTEAIALAARNGWL